MEHEWQRQKPFHQLTLMEIQEILVPTGLVVARKEPISEGLANSNYWLLTDEGKELLFRYCQSDVASKPLMVAISRRLGNKLPVPHVLEEMVGTPYLIFDWLPGMTVQSLHTRGNTTEILETAHSIGQALAKIARHKYNVCGFVDAKLKIVEPWGNLFEAFLRHTTEHAKGAQTRDRLSRELVKGVAEVWTKREAGLRSIMDKPCLSHGDFKASNLLVQNGRLSGILDWEFVHSGTWLLDAGQILRYMGGDRDDFVEKFEEGLEFGGLSVPSDWQNLARTVDLMNLIDFLDRPEVSEAQHSQIVGLITESVEILT